MRLGEKIDKWLAAVITLFARNWMTLFGAVLSAVSALLIIGFMLLGALQLTNSPYLGIMAFLILPAVFVAGLLIIPVGAYWERRRRSKAGLILPVEAGYPSIDLNNSHTRHVAGLVLILTVFNLLLVSTVSYKGVVYMDSVQFCGQVCHTVMEPEHTAYLGSPHSRVACVDCHIGPGAPWFVRSKLSGVRQVFAVTFNTYERPIPVPVHNLRPSRDTCEHCHWPERFSGDRVKVITRFRDDEANTPTKTVLLMHVGGGASKSHGIHSWHIDPSKRTFYFPADAQRQKIAKVRVEDVDGGVVEFTDPEWKAGNAADEREMDCIDCHNRPTHVFALPAKALDDSMADGRIDTSLPYIKKFGVEALTQAKGEEGGKELIANHIRSLYQEKYPDVYTAKRDAIEKAIDELIAIYGRNVFPNMKVSWGTYPNNIGHDDSPGCFRCHDDVMKSKEDKTIGQDCTVCHAVLAWDEENPEILKQLELQ